jgi:Spy/CpxP family protein refolding chaperone
MNHLSRWKVALYLAAIFVAGGVTGWTIAARATKEKMYSSFRSDEFAAHLRERVRSGLDLTPDQAAKIEPIIERTCSEMKSIHRDTYKRISQIISNLNAQIAAELTPDQKAKFEQMEKDRQESTRRKFKSRSELKSESR